MKLKHIVFGVALSVLLFTSTLACLAASFSADMVEIKGGQSKTNKFFFQGRRYRIDVSEGDRTLHIIVDRKSGKTRIVVPNEKVYLEIDNTDMKSLVNNPFEAHAHTAARFEARFAGNAQVNGMACEKTIYSSQGKDVMTAWIAGQYQLPFKMDNPLNGQKVELVQIKKGPQDAALFKVPAGFKQVKHMPVAPPEWAKDIAGAPAVTAPFKDRPLGQGELIRIKPVKDHRIKLTLKNPTGQKSNYTSVAFQDHRPIRRLNPTNVPANGSRKAIHRETLALADEIVVRANAGKMTVNAELIEAPEGILLKKHDQKVNSGREVSLDHRKAARIVIADKAADGKASRGTIDIYTTITKDMGGGTTVYEKKHLHKEALQLANGASKVFRFERRQEIGVFGVDIREGGVAVRIEQPEKAGTIPPSWDQAAPSPLAKTSGAVAPSTPSKPTPAAMPTKATAAAPSLTPKADLARMVLVLDASGSMWGQIQGKAKMAIAKAVTADLIDQIPANLQVGLTAYGHRRKGDCQDIEMLVPVGQLDVAAMKAKIKAITPKGKTPLSAAVKQAAKALRFTQARATVVLVSDGLETCDLNPCAVAAELAMSGMDFTVHVIGFDISKEEQTRLRCLADKTGGLFLAADDAPSLADALSQTVVKAQQPPALVKEDPGKATLKGPDSIPVGAAFKVLWEGPDSRRDYIAIAKKSDKEKHSIDYAYTEKGNPAQLTAPGDPGDYVLRYMHAHSRKVIGFSPIKVTPVQASVEPPASARVAAKFSVAWQGPAYAADYITVAKPGDPAGRYDNYAYTRDGSPVTLQAPAEAGTYEVRYILARGTTVLAKAPMAIQAAGAMVQPPGSASAGSAFDVTWNGPANQADYITVAKPDAAAGRYDNYAYTRNGNPAKLKAPSEPGAYEVRYIQAKGTQVLAKAPIDIQAVSAQVKPQSNAQAGASFEVTWQGPGYQADYITVAKPGDVAGRYDNYTYTRKGSPLKLQAPSEPGAYEVRYILAQGTKILAKAPITVTAVSAKVTAPASVAVGSEFSVAFTGPDYKGDYLTIVKPEAPSNTYGAYCYTSKGSPGKLKAPSEPGAYEVRYIMNKGKQILGRALVTVN